MALVLGMMVCEAKLVMIALSVHTSQWCLCPMSCTLLSRVELEEMGEGQPSPPKIWLWTSASTTIGPA